MADATWISLEDLLAASGPPQDEQFQLVASWVAQALADGHQQGAVHGALTPRVVGLDLSAAGTPTRASIRPPEDDPALVESYAAPEVVAGRAPDAAADVYSCGAVLWHCRTGQTPRPGQAPALPTGDTGDTVSPVITAMLAAAPEERPLAGDAARLMAGSPIASAPQAADAAPLTPAAGDHPRPPAESRQADARPGRPRGWLLPLAALVMVLGLAAMGWVLWNVLAQDADSPGTATSTPTVAEGEASGEEQDTDESAITGTESTTAPVGAAPTATPPEATTEPERTEEPTTEEPREISLPSTAELCEDGLDDPYPQVWSGNEVTSCPFAVNVRDAYVELDETGEDVEVEAYSPATSRWFTMTCEDTAPVRCRGGNSAIVLFGED